MSTKEAAAWFVYCAREYLRLTDGGWARVRACFAT